MIWNNSFHFFYQLFAIILHISKLLFRGISITIECYIFNKNNGINRVLFYLLVNIYIDVSLFK